MASDQDGHLARVDRATLPCRPDAPWMARALVARWLDDSGHPELREDACLLVTELVTNCVLHAGQAAGAPLQLSATATDGVVRVQVDDLGRGPIRPRVPAPDKGGYGLHLVDLVAARWGVDHVRGTEVWFELAAHRTRSL
jgi:anti-sigma regulatory factor (Ser/Thr protein kinase)